MASEAANAVQPVEVFLSYSHQDERMRTRLDTHLSLLKRQHFILSWHDRKITAGSEWKGQIDQHINSADVILLLVTADFLASDYCYDIEMKRALARHDAGEARVIPIILRPCDWTSADFGKLQALPRDGKPISSWTTQDHAFSEVARGLRRAIAEAAITGDDTQSKAPVRPRIEIPTDVRNTLERLRVLNALAKADDELLVDEAMMKEHRTLLRQMVLEFLPLVNLLVRAGLLTTSISLENVDCSQHRTLTGEPTLVFDNGNIWIDTEYSGGILAPDASDLEMNL